MMYLANSAQLQGLRLKGTQGGRDYVGPAGQTPGQQDREIVSFDGRVLVLKYVDPEIDGRYGTGILSAALRMPERAGHCSASATMMVKPA